MEIDDDDMEDEIDIEEGKTEEPKEEEEEEVVIQQ